MSTAPAPARPHTKWPLALVFGAIGALIVGVVMLAFLWPTVTSDARNLPVSVSGPTAAVEAFESGAEAASPGLFDFVAATDRDDAVAQIENRDTYGAIVLGETPEVLTAPAGSAVASQLLTGIAAQLQGQLQGQVAAAGGDASAVTVSVTPVVTLSETDANGAGLTSAAFPILLGGMLGGILISLLVVGVIRRLVALAAFGIVAGVVMTLVMQTWFEFLQGDFLLNALALGLSVTATSAFIVGCTALLGTKGISIGAVVTMFVGNPLSAVASPWQFLAEPWGTIGQFLVPGAANSLIRGLSYFPDADLGRQWLVLSGWVVLGGALAIAGHFRSRAAVRVPAATLEAVPA